MRFAAVDMTELSRQNKNYMTVCVRAARLSSPVLATRQRDSDRFDVVCTACPPS